jgi:orotidine-5'-phosphate decarboxylase
VIDVVSRLVPAVKVQAAFFEELGPPGMAVMANVIVRAQAAGLLVIVDGKRNDIGNTAAAYARAYLGRGVSSWSADALTVSPYLGDDSLTPFVEVARERGAGLFVLVKTSNPGGRMLQDAVCDGAPLYRRLADHVESLAADTAGSSGYGSIGAVVGATYPEQLVELRAVMPHTWFLVPGYGAQGGAARDVAPAFDSQGLGAIVNSSRGIIFAHARKDFAQRFPTADWQRAVEAATREMIEQLRADTPAGKLVGT